MNMGAKGVRNRLSTIPTPASIALLPAACRACLRTEKTVCTIAPFTLE